MTAIFNIVAVPFGVVMKYIYMFIGSYGLSIITFSFLAKMITLPITIKQKRSAVAMQALQPKMQELQRKYGKEPKRYQEELQNLYASEGVNPMGGCGTALLTMPIMIGLYYVISSPLSYFMRITQDQIAEISAALGHTATGVGSQVGLAGEIYERFAEVAHLAPNLMHVDFNFLGINLSLTPQIGEPGLIWIMPIISALSALGMSLVTQWSTKRGAPAKKAADDPMARTNTIMMLMMPVMSLYFGFILPAGLSLYWISNSVFSMLQDLALSYTVFKKRDSASE